MRLLYLIRGLPGSGKTTLAHRLSLDRHHCFAADDWFSRNGNYKFDPSQIGQAHESCRNAVEAVMTGGTGPIAVHNTFSQPWEAEPYWLLAEQYEYDVFVIECQNAFENTHNVPLQQIDAMRARWLPLWGAAR